MDQIAQEQRNFNFTFTFKSQLAFEGKFQDSFLCFLSAKDAKKKSLLAASQLTTQTRCDGISEFFTREERKEKVKFHHIDEALNDA
jgi:hypothetical protein